ncbi:ArsC family reductase [Viridibacterium curvum]|uniref:ArsC family reductase n=1 Tax=Viridibacterium curvum TaxID=1101404 RepID=A0ABP9QCR5_9RHOO
MITLYGIPNCDSVKKGRTWLDDKGMAYAFHDFRKQGLDSALLKGWLKQADWKVLLNTKGTTWRKLSEEERTNPDLAKATELMLAYPTLIKRPVVAHAGGLLVGFDAERWQAELSA